MSLSFMSPEGTLRQFSLPFLRSSFPLILHIWLWSINSAQGANSCQLTGRGKVKQSSLLHQARCKVLRDNLGRMSFVRCQSFANIMPVVLGAERAGLRWNLGVCM